MPKLASSKKRLRQNEKARLRNKSVRTLLRSTIKKLTSAPSKAEAEALLGPTQSVIDKTVKKGVIHANAAARYKSKITRHVAALEA
ncbi:MAG: 30S ribosomal protein S20 [Candidatus Latescibacteria bacterium]|nr:30S ribosomal protein S20 [Candidatus Latescibacterota bacterium]MBT4139493.1 30S ribosomal protein S20 [Candidatus Latescibacterota bacterium]